MSFTANDVLREAKKVLQDNGWIKGKYAEAKDGHTTSAQSPEACNFCLIGAMERAHFTLSKDPSPLPRTEQWNEAINALAKVTQGRITEWNDEVAQTVDDVLDALDKAINDG